MARDQTARNLPPRRARGIRAVAAFCRRLTRELFDPYHPERHYMRGPGPKWQAKQSFEAGAR
jgi:hypothetical protein